MYDDLLDDLTLADLVSHQAIGWDFDNTLVNNPNQHLFWWLIKRFPAKRHVIVTYRSHGLQDRLWADLKAQGSSLSRDDFVAVRNVPDAVFASCVKHIMARRAKVLRGKWTAAEIAYRDWKGLTCKDNGLTIMVDDDLPTIQAGCERYGVAVFDSLYRYL